jgi:OTU domain-containing protein 6
LSSSAENAAAVTGHTEEEDERERIEHKKEKAKKKKDKKAQKEKEREEEKVNILAAAAGIKTLRDIEIEALGIQLNSLQLSVRDVPSDGHCLYRAIADQLRLLSLPVSPSITEEYGVILDFKNLRKIAANHLRSHREQFAPFICSDTDSTHFDEYCHKVESEALAEWGGQIEIRALAEALGVEICVHSADSAPLHMSPDGSSHWGERPVLLSFHRHLFNLGEHYNSLVSR